MASKRKASVLLHKETLPAPIATESSVGSDSNADTDPYAGLMKDADKLKLMLLAWNYQNSNAVRNGTEGPDLGVVGGLWAQYQNALAQNAVASGKIDTSLSPVPRTDMNSPMEGQDETNSSGQKEEDEGSEDDSDDKLDEKLATHDPERLKAFNMFVRLFVDENLDRIVPISKQPKEKIQAIIDSCARQFPEFSDRSRKRIRTYLKSCRRNKKTRDGWDNTTRPTPAHLTSVQAEQILAIACENESMNAKRMRIGLEPITHAIPAPGSVVAAAAAAVSATSSVTTVGGSNSTMTSVQMPTEALTSVTATTVPFATSTSFARSTTNPETADPLSLTPAVAVAAAAAAAVAASSNASGSINSARSSPLALSSNASVGGSTTSLDIKPLSSALANGNTVANGIGVASTAAGLAGLPATSPLYRTSDFASPSAAVPFVAAAAAAVAGRTTTYPSYFPSVTGLGNATPTDLSMKNSSTNISSNTFINVTSNCNNNLATSAASALSNISGNINNNNTLVTATQLQQIQQQQHQQQQQQQQQQQLQAGQGIATASLGAQIDTTAVRAPPLLTHKLSPNEITAARQVISAYRESAAFLLRTADQVEQLLIQQQ